MISGQYLTEPYKVEPSRYLSTIAARIAGRLWWVGLLPVALIVYGLAADVRFAFVGLIVLLLIFPVAVTTALLSHALSPELAGRASSTLAAIDGDSLTLYRRLDLREAAPESPSVDPSAVPFSSAGDTPCRLVEIERLPVVDIHEGTRYCLVVTGRGIADFVLIPATALN